MTRTDIARIHPHKDAPQKLPAPPLPEGVNILATTTAVRIEHHHPTRPGGYDAATATRLAAAALSYIENYKNRVINGR
jgi:hypothetical protein